MHEDHSHSHDHDHQQGLPQDHPQCHDHPQPDTLPNPSGVGEFSAEPDAAARRKVTYPASARRILWVDPCGGMAGDMFLASLLDLQQPGFDLAKLQELADALVPGEAQLTQSAVLRQGLAARHLDVRTPETDQAPHRGLAELTARIDACEMLGAQAKARSQSVLLALAQAEAKVHGTTIEAIHFHEVGAVDTLIDVCGAALAWQELGIEAMHSRPPLLGSGNVRCAHGLLPVPAPATAALLTGLPTQAGGGGERTTPTGAALLAAWACFEEPAGAVRSQAIGYGAGTRDPGRNVGPANFLRVTLLERAERVAPGSTVWQLEVNLDDITGEDLAVAIESLWASGAVDVWTQSIAMKKQRPGTLLAALVPQAQRAAVEEAVLAHTPTFGMRWIRTERVECARRFEEIQVQGLTVRIKLRQAPASGASWDPFPEFEDVRTLALAQGIPTWKARQVCLQAYAQRDRG